MGAMFEPCLIKQKKLIELFARFADEESKYDYIIQLGKKCPSFPDAAKVPSNLVKGCQSLMYLLSKKEGDFLLFQAKSDALISQGLAELLIAVYSGEKPETILKCAPHFIDTIGITESLTPNRANGLYSIHLRMKQEALKALLEYKSAIQ